MSNIIRIQIPHCESSVSRRVLRSIGLKLKRDVEKTGAKCVPVWADSILTITVEGAALPLVETVLKAFMKSVRKAGGKLSIAQWDPAESPLGDVAADTYRPGMIIRERLTRRLLFSLPAGAFVVSNLFTDLKCAFAEQLGDVRLRRQEWNRAVASGAAQRVCEILWTEADFREAAKGNLF